MRVTTEQHLHRERVDDTGSEERAGDSTLVEPRSPDSAASGRNRILYFIVVINFFAMLIYRVKTGQLSGGSGWLRALFLVVALSIAYDFLFGRPIRMRAFTIPLES